MQRVPHPEKLMSCRGSCSSVRGGAIPVTFLHTTGKDLACLTRTHSTAKEIGLLCSNVVSKNPEVFRASLALEHVTYLQDKVCIWNSSASNTVPLRIPSTRLRTSTLPPGRSEAYYADVT